MPAKRRRCATPQPDPSLPGDVFLQLIPHLRGSVAALLRLMLTCREAYAAIRHNRALWLELLAAHEGAVLASKGDKERLVYHVYKHQVVKDVTLRAVPNFDQNHWCTSFTLHIRSKEPLKWSGLGHAYTNEEEHALVEHSFKVMSLLHVKMCWTCKARFRHTPYWSLGRRVCHDCARDNLISSVVLYTDYGVSYWSILDAIKGKVFYFPTGRASSYVLRHYSHDPSEYDRERDERLMRTFFWRPHLEKFLDLPALKVQHAQRKAAAAFLAARLRRLHVCVIIGSKGLRLREVLGCNTWDNRMRIDRTELMRRVLSGALDARGVQAIEEISHKQLVMAFRGRPSLPCSLRCTSIVYALKEFEAWRRLHRLDVPMPDQHHACAPKKTTTNQGLYMEYADRLFA